MKQLHSMCSKGAVAWCVAIVVWLLLALFFGLALPYHLFYREQTSLFLWAWSDWLPWLTEPGAVAEWLGRFVTQFCYYEAVGPLLLSLLLVAWAAGVYRLTSILVGWRTARPSQTSASLSSSQQPLARRGRFLKLLPGLVALLLLLWEAGRASVIAYPFSSTVALAGWAWTFVGLLKLGRRCCWRTLVGQLLLLAWALYAWGGGCWSIGWGKPDFALERSLALDCETYFGRQERLQRLLEHPQPAAYPLVTDYYTHLARAMQGRLPDELLTAYRSGEKGLFLPVDRSGNYFSIYAANEVWFALGDYTMAEHAAILGMIFSPQHRGGRALKRLAEINLIVGDEDAAMKYLRMLDKTLCYRRWARQRMPQSRTEAVNRWLQQKRAALVPTDTLRLNGDVVTSLRHLLQQPTCSANAASPAQPASPANPVRAMQLDYLLCYHLMRKDVRSFAEDYLRYAFAPAPQAQPTGSAAPSGGPRQLSLHGLYAEAMMIYLASTPQAARDSIVWHFPEEMMQRFRSYSRRYQETGGSAKELYADYGSTYWFYVHFAQRKGGSHHEE